PANSSENRAGRQSPSPARGLSWKSVLRGCDTNARKRAIVPSIASRRRWGKASLLLRSVRQAALREDPNVRRRPIGTTKGFGGGLPQFGLVGKNPDGSEAGSEPLVERRRVDQNR